MFVNLGQGFLVIIMQLNLLPQIPGCMGALDRFHVQITHTFLLSDGGVPTICQRARISVTKTSDVVFVAAEGCVFGHLAFERTVAMVDNVPNYFVVLHLSFLGCQPQQQQLLLQLPFKILSVCTRSTVVRSSRASVTCHCLSAVFFVQILCLAALNQVIRFYFFCCLVC